MTCYEGLEGGERYSCTLSLTSALDGMGDQRHAPAALPKGLIRYPLYGRWVGPRAGLDGYRKFRSLPGSDHRTVQPVTSGILTHMVKKYRECWMCAWFEISAAKWMRSAPLWGRWTACSGNVRFPKSNESQQTSFETNDYCNGLILSVRFDFPFIAD